MEGIPDAVRRADDVAHWTADALTSTGRTGLGLLAVVVLLSALAVRDKSIDLAVVAGVLAAATFLVAMVAHWEDWQTTFTAVGACALVLLAAFAGVAALDKNATDTYPTANIVPESTPAPIPAPDPFEGEKLTVEQWETLRALRAAAPAT